MTKQELEGAISLLIFQYSSYQKKISPDVCLGFLVEPTIYKEKASYKITFIWNEGFKTTHSGDSEPETKELTVSDFFYIDYEEVSFAQLEQLTQDVLHKVSETKYQQIFA